MLALKIAKMSPTMTSTIVKHGALMPMRAIAGKTALRTWNLHAVEHKNFIISKPIPSFLGNLTTMRFCANQPSFTSQTFSKIRMYWNIFIEKKEKFEDDVDQYLAPWPKIRMFRRRLIARMQAVRGYIFRRIWEAILFLFNKEMWEMNFYRTLGIAWDITGYIFVWTSKTFEEHIVKNPTVQVYQKEFLGKMKKSKEVVPFPPGKQDVENFFYRLVALIWDLSFWLINSTVVNFNQHVTKNPKVRMFSSQLVQKMQKARNGNDTSNRPPTTFIN